MVFFHKENSNSWSLQYKDLQDDKDMKIEETFVSARKNEKSKAHRISFYPKTNLSEIVIKLNQIASEEMQGEGGDLSQDNLI